MANNDLRVGVEGVLSKFVMILNWKELLMLSRVERPCKEILTNYRAGLPSKLNLQDAGTEAEDRRPEVSV